MRIKNKKQYYISRRIINTDDEGNKIESGTTKELLIANIYPANGKLEIEEYGERINNIFNMLIEGPYTTKINNNKTIFCLQDIELTEGDFIHVFNQEKPDYKIIAIKPYSHLICQIEAIK